MSTEEFNKIYPGKTILLYKDGTECLLEGLLCYTGKNYDGYWLMVTKDTKKSIEECRKCDPANMTPDEFQGDSEDFEVVDYGYKREE